VCDLFFTVYINSYALKSVYIKFTPPIPVQDPIRLPADWKQPRMLSEEDFRVRLWDCGNPG